MYCGRRPSGWWSFLRDSGKRVRLRRQTLEKIPYDASSIVEDLEYHLRLVTAGERVDFIGDATVFGEIRLRAERQRFSGRDGRAADCGWSGVGAAMVRPG